MITSSDPSLEVVTRLQRAINSHDLHGVVSCFAPDYRNETPAHPARSFTGRDQVRRNWAHILASVPDLTAELRAAQPGPDVVWVEWQWAGTRPDGTGLHLRGVTILDVEDRLIARARFYLEPVDPDPATYDTVVPAQVGTEPVQVDELGAR